MKTFLVYSYIEARMIVLAVCFLTIQIHADAMRRFHSEKISELNITAKEVEAYFGEMPGSKVLNYDVSYFTSVNDRGEKISSRQRSKRDIKDKRLIFYNISIHGVAFHLNLSLNHDLLSPGFHILTKHSNGSTTKSFPAHKNFYHGHVISYPGSKVALSGKDGMRGTLVLSNDHIFEIHPLPNHLSKKHENNDLPHLVIKRSITDKLVQFDNNWKDMNPTLKEKRSSEQEQSGCKNSKEIKFLEVIYVADTCAIELYGLIDLSDMLLSVSNIVSKIIYGISNCDQKVIYVINKIHLLNDETLTCSRDVTKLQKVREITKWAEVNNVPDDANPNPADVTVRFTAYNNGGMATLGVMCRRRDASALVSLCGLSSSFLTAHEILHSVGCGHDGGTGCPDGAGVMSTYLPSGGAAFFLSNCTKQCATKFLKSTRSHCLDNLPAVAGPTQSPSLYGKLPGEVFNADKQCEMIFGAGKKQCATKKNVCSSLYCTRSSSTCSYMLSPPADGTRCGRRHWCIHGKCVDDGSPLINGNWGEWSDYTPCTRSCGGGIQHKTRKCNNPSPKNGGMECVGSDIGHHRMCNIKDCPKGVESYRNLQCMEAGYSSSYHIAAAPCALWCVRNWEILYHGNVLDGTPCTNDPTNHDVCVGGICQSVGCDWILHSDTEKDRCGVCDGNGNTCRKREIYFTENRWLFGTKNPLQMVELKRGSSNIDAKKTAATWNWIGVQNMMDEYLIKLPKYSKTVYKAGTKISYIHKTYQFRDELIIPGPIQEVLQLVFVRNYEYNHGVNISYYEPVHITETLSPHLFSWKEYEWSECSENCGGGFRKRDVKCYRKDDMSIVGKRFCNSMLKPLEKELCYTPCPAEWFTTDWKPCSKTCGGGIQTRNIICRRKKTNSWIIEDDSACVDQKPVEPVLERPCNEVICPPQYVPLAWSECSTSCGEGVSTRELKCQMINETGISDVVPVNVCQQNNSPLPHTTRRCNYDISCQDKALNYHFMGCFFDSLSSTSRLLPEMLENLRSKIDWHNPSATVDECAILASKKGKEYFGIQYYGECRSYKNENRLDYTKLGISHEFWAGLGGPWTNCVYRFM